MCSLAERYRLRTYGPKGLLFLKAILFMCFFISACTWAEFKIAVINDSDGYTNVRKAADPHSKVVLKIEEDQLFLCETGKDAWWKAKDFFGNEGFIHKSKVLFYTDLNKKEKEAYKGSLLGQIRDSVRVRNRAEPSKESPGIYYGSFDIHKQLKQFCLSESACEGAHSMDLLFIGEDTPDVILEHVPHHPDWNINNIRKALPLLISNSSPTTEVFTTVRGLALGSGVDHAIKLFGRPHNKKVEDGVEILTWLWYSMDLDENIVLLENENPLWLLRGMQERQGGGASFSVTMYFRKNKLIGLKYERNSGDC